MQAVLWGREHAQLGEVAIQAVSDDVACGLTRGQRRKAYPYVEPNEDTVAALVGSQATLLAVADGHNGFEAAEAAMRTVLDRLGGELPPADLADGDLVDLFFEASEAICAETAVLAPPRAGSRTTLALALISPGWISRGDARRLQWASIGDSAVFVVTALAGWELSDPRQEFVGRPISRAELAARLQRGSLAVPADAWVVVVSDGFTNFVGPEVADRVLFGLIGHASRDGGTVASVVVRAIIDCANANGAGDNVAVAVAAPPRDLTGLTG
ncbi:MAG: PP2C family protein-serine/threonine phosphatase [Gaiellaceae bacterium]